LDANRLLEEAHAVADEALQAFFEEGMFQGYPGSHVYEAVDGVGFLLLALLFLEHGQEGFLPGWGV
jgi:hypothetical protein